jgi:crotonobetainyl-CoA:carnitine CoA-transferase CaiB-like acyl-CoA transferase
MGIGQWIDLSQREALSQMFGEAIVMAARGQSVPMSGNRDPMMAPHGCYRCRGTDRWIVVAIRSEEEWLKLCGVMGRDSLATDPRFAKVEARKKNEDELDSEVEAWTTTLESGEAVERLRQAGIAAGIVANGRDLATDPHLAARGFFDRMIDWEGKAFQIPVLPWTYARAANGTLRPAPRLGEHNQQVLGGLLGLMDAEIEEIQ